MIEKIIIDVEEKLKDHPKRLNHTREVVKMAIKLAKHYELDTKKAEIAAWYHDYAKYDEIKDQVRFIDLREIKKYADTPVMYHALAAASLISINHGIDDREISEAIRNHVWGASNLKPLDKILLLSDKISLERNYPGVDHLRLLAFTNLNKAVLSCLECILEDAIRKGLKPHPEQREIITEIKELL